MIIRLWCHFALEMRTREIWFTYTTRDPPHKKGAILETKFLGVNSVTKLLLKQLKPKKIFVKFTELRMLQSLRDRRWHNQKICHGIINSSSAVLADKITTSANVKASYEVFSGMTSAPVTNTLMEMLILPKWKVLILFTSNYLLRHILSQGVQGKTGVEGVSGPEVSFAPSWNA